MRIKKITKKILCSILVVIMCLTAVPIQGFVDLDRAWFDFNIKANAATVDGYYTYEVNAGEVTITDVDTSISGDVTIPSTLGGYPVTSIGDYAFAGCSGLSSVTIPDSVTDIGRSAFEGCTGLSSITIPDSVTDIGSFAFEGCTGLSSITIPDSVTSISSGAFNGCTNLSSITIPDSVTSIGDYAFDGCTGLSSITIPDSVTYIGYSAFYDCTGLSSITIPDSVTYIGWSAFWGCTNLSSIYVDENNEYYSSDSYGVLFNKDKTELVRYPIGNSRTSYSIPDSVTYIGYFAFYGCTDLSNITIPDSVTYIEDSAFYGCTNLSSITIPDSLTYIGWCAFYDCTGLSDVYYSGTEQQWNQIAIDDNEYLTNATIHYNHKHSYKTVVTASTCTKEGYTTYTCECGDSYTEKIAIDANAHMWDGGKVTTAATCSAEGVKTFTCSCGDSYTEKIAINASNHVNTKNVAEVKPTTENVGYTAGVYCNDCKKYISGHSEIPKIAASFTDSENAKKDGNNVLVNQGLSSKELLSQAGKNAVIKDTKGNILAADKLPGTGMTIILADGKKYVIVVFGDIDGSGTITAADARLTLRASVGLENYQDGSAQHKAANVESKDKLSAADARLILRASVGLENPKSWMK